ncbi:MAG: DUF362 domain-containing protein [Gemmatimonadetes bacterium]|jgi:hypothetical protein|nr:DUF362 domain-containing protein [Gemmatimonadota bacterium]
MFLKRKWTKMGILGLVAGLVGLDIAVSDRLEGNRQLIIPQVDTELLGTSTVAIATSQDLDEPVPLNRDLTTEQVDAIVKRAIGLDSSDRNLAAVIEPGDWVAIKVNIVTAPLVINDKKMTAFWFNGTEHWGQNTDLRVVRSVIDHLINEEKDVSRVTIVEGGAEWSKVGEEGTDPAQTEDGWTVQWEKFGNLSYAGIVEEFNGVNGVTVDIVDLNYDDWVGTEGVGAGDPLPVPDPNHSGIGGYQRAEEGYYVSKTLLEVDKLINIPAIKTHDHPGVTLIHKQYVGTFMQRAYGNRNNSKYSLHNYISGVGDVQVTAGFIDLFSYRPTDYGIIEGFWGTEGTGPQWGEDVQHNVVIASGDPVAADAVTAAMMDFNPEDLWYLKFSAAKGFGTYDLDNIQVVGRQIDEVQRTWKKAPLNSWGSRNKEEYDPNVWGWGNRQWLVNGPYDNGDLQVELIEGEADLRPIEGEETNGIVWKVATGAPVPRQQFLTLPEDYVGTLSMTYAFAYIHSDRDQDGYLYFLGDDGLKIWLSGQEVYANERITSRTLGDEKVAVSLRKGLNPVVVKVRNRFGQAGLALVAGDEGGDTLPGIEYLLEPPATNTAVTRETSGLPIGFELGANYPNPFNPETVIPYSLPGPGPVELTIFDVRGAKVRTLVDQVLPGGSHATRWDGRNDAGQQVASGIYLYRLAISNAEQTERMTLVR